MTKFNFNSLAYDPNKPRNVADYLKWLTDDETKKYLSERRLNFSVLILNVLLDNNAGNIVRSANAFGAQSCRGLLKHRGISPIDDNSRTLPAQSLGNRIPDSAG